MTSAKTTTPIHQRLINASTFAIIAGNTPKAQECLANFQSTYPATGDNDLTWREVSRIEADVLITLGGDGVVLDVLQHQLQHERQFLFAMNCGTVGFLTNPYTTHDLIKRMQNAKVAHLCPLRVTVINTEGKKSQHLAFNDVAMLRETHQTAKITVKVDGVTRIKTLVGEGILVSTPAGSTAYNYSARGPVLPLNANVLALTPLNPFRPRGWRGALIHQSSRIRLGVNDHVKRPVSATIDSLEVRDVKEISVEQYPKHTAYLLFDNKAHLDGRIIKEAFATN